MPTVAEQFIEVLVQAGVRRIYGIVGDSLNPIGNQEQTVSAQLAALELSYDRDWARFRVSGLYSSGDGDASNSRATGFDSPYPPSKLEKHYLPDLDRVLDAVDRSLAF